MGHLGYIFSFAIIYVNVAMMEIFNLFISYSFDNRFMAIVKIGAWSRALGHFNLHKRFHIKQRSSSLKILRIPFHRFIMESF